MSIADVSPGLGWLDIPLELMAAYRHDRTLSEVTVEILATGLPLDVVRARLHGWELAMGTPDGLEWLRKRLTTSTS
jgi:hypothetical protein